MNKKVKKTLVGFIEIIGYIALTLALIWGVPKALGYVLDTNYPIAVVTSGSMWPTLKEGDLVLVKGAAGGDVLGVSEIAVYEHQNGFAIHRVVEKGENTFVTKGDANNKEDAPVRYEQLVGTAVTFGGKPFRIPYVGKLGQAVRAAVTRN